MIAPPAGRIRARIGLIRCRSAAAAAGSDGEDRLDLRDPLAGQRPVEHRGGQHLDQVRGGAADRDDLARAWRRAPRGRPRSRPRRIAATSVGGRRIVLVTNASVSRADPSRRPAARGGRDRIDDAEFGAAAADVDDEGLLGDRHPLGHADDREVAPLPRVTGRGPARPTRRRPRGRCRRHRRPAGSVRCRGTSRRSRRGGAPIRRSGRGSPSARRGRPDRGSRARRRPSRARGRRIRRRAAGAGGRRRRRPADGPNSSRDRPTRRRPAAAGRLPRAGRGRRGRRPQDGVSSGAPSVPG